MYVVLGMTNSLKHILLDQVLLVSEEKRLGLWARVIYTPWCVRHRNLDAAPSVYREGRGV